jgi:hypothetical protein
VHGGAKVGKNRVDYEPAEEMFKQKLTQIASLPLLESGDN